MIQNAIKILTAGFFISMITGFVMYRSGYFDSQQTSSALHTSPNGGELNLAQVDQDSTKQPQINQANQAPVMPSSKVIVPVLDVESAIQKVGKEILPSSKSMLHPIQIEPGEWKVDDELMYSSKSMTHVIDVKPTPIELIEGEEEDQVSEEGLRSIEDIPENSETIVREAKEKIDSETKSTPTNWGAIWIGVLGILFVAIGSIVYFKRRSK